ncbi:hypothetical protein [Parendozoicomonas sp. Alg238-R29]|nr:hypothetical protein [Parendozoicomonas sp. Alg238-R29]
MDIFTALESRRAVKHFDTSTKLTDTEFEKASKRKLTLISEG